MTKSSAPLTATIGRASCDARRERFRALDCNYCSMPGMTRQPLIPELANHKNRLNSGSKAEIDFELQCTPAILDLRKFLLRFDLL